MSKVIGVLVIAHGSSNANWIKEVEQVVSEVQMSLPIKLAFLEMVPGRSILDGVRSLAALGVTQMMVVPLFVSSGSTHIAEIRDILSFPNNEYTDIEADAALLMQSCIFCSTMDDHDLIRDIVLERIFDLDCSPYSIVLLGHGSKQPGFKEAWANMMLSLVNKVRMKLNGGVSITGATLYDLNLTDLLLSICQRYDNTIVIPLFLSEGYFTKKIIPKYLPKNTLYNGKAYLPHFGVTRWIESEIMQNLDLVES